LINWPGVIRDDLGQAVGTRLQCLLTTRIEIPILQGDIASEPPSHPSACGGFDSSSPILGHVGVLLSSDFVDNGRFALTMDDFWAWFLRDKNVGGGSNGSSCSSIPVRSSPGRGASDTADGK
jgi:hypothetical protein